MQIDHIFIFTSDQGKIADELVSFGLSEGSRRVHPGQGTMNRKFYFENFFLEVLWVHDEKELNSPQTKESGLWRRTHTNQGHFSPFGLCLVNTHENDLLFESSLKYQPDYFPEGFAIDVLKNVSSPGLPWTFRLPFKGQKKNDHEPLTHGNGIRKLTKAIFEYQSDADVDFLGHFETESQLSFRQGPRNWLHLTFDNAAQGGKQVFEKLQLTVEY